MRNLLLAAATAALSLTLSSQAFALNPQPEPPGKNRVMFVPKNQFAIGSQSSGAGRFSDGDGYCGTRVPGHIPHVVGPVRGGYGRAVADYDGDGYCGTPVPGHWGGPHYGVSQFHSHVNVMLNPQPLPPKARVGY